MPVPYLIIGLTAHSAWKQRKWKKIHDERFAEVEIVQAEAEAVYRDFATAGESLGQKRVHASKVLEQAAQYLRGVARDHQLEALPEVPNEDLEEWITLQSDLAKSLGVGIAGSTVSGVTAAGGSILYTAAGLFGVASTGTRIAGLTGAAAHGARLAWIGGGALATGGGGVALGSAVLNILSKANVITAPIALAAGVWSEKKAHDLEKAVTAKLKEFSKAEISLRKKATAMQISIPRIEELRGSIAETEPALRELLQKGSALPDPTSPAILQNANGEVEPDLHVPRQVLLPIRIAS